MVNSITDALATDLPLPSINASQLNPPSGDKSYTSKPDPAESDFRKQNKDDQTAVNKAVEDRDNYMVNGRPKFPELAPEPKNDNSDNALKGYVSAIGVLGAIGSMFTRAPMTNAMNAAGAAIKSMNEQDAQGFKQNYEAWKTQNENALKLFDYQNDTYKAILGDKNKSVDERLAELKANATAFKDDLTLKLLEARNPSIIEDNLAKADVAKGKLQESLDKIQNDRDNMQLIEDGMTTFFQANPNATPQQANAEKIRLKGQIAAASKGNVSGTTGAKGLESIIADPNSTVDQINDATSKLQKIANAKKGGTELSDEDYNKLKTRQDIIQGAEAYHSGMLLAQVAPGRGTNNPQREAITRLAAEKWPDFNPAEAHIQYLANSKELNTVAGQAAKLNLAANMLDNSLPALQKAAEKVGLSDSTDINALYNAVRKHLNDKDFENFQAQLRAAAGDYAQFIGRGSGGTVHSDEEALKILNTNLDDTSLQGFVDAVKIERANVRQAISMTKKDAIGGNNSQKSEPQAWQIDKLRANPSLAKDFDEKFGEGAAEKILGGQ